MGKRGEEGKYEVSSTKTEVQRNSAASAFSSHENKNSLISALVLDSHTDRWETEIRSHWNSLAQTD